VNSYYIFAGSEGTEAITHIAQSDSGIFLSVCERNVKNEKGLVNVYRKDGGIYTKVCKLPDAID